MSKTSGVNGTSENFATQLTTIDLDMITNISVVHVSSQSAMSRMWRRQDAVKANLFVALKFCLESHIELAEEGKIVCNNSVFCDRFDIYVFITPTPTTNVRKSKWIVPFCCIQRLILKFHKIK